MEDQASEKWSCHEVHQLVGQLERHVWLLSFDTWRRCYSDFLPPNSFQTSEYRDVMRVGADLDTDCTKVPKTTYYNSLMYNIYIYIYYNYLYIYIAEKGPSSSIHAEYLQVLSAPQKSAFQSWRTAPTKMATVTLQVASPTVTVTEPIICIAGRVAALVSCRPPDGIKYGCSAPLVSADPMSSRLEGGMVQGKGRVSQDQTSSGLVCSVAVRPFSFACQAVQASWQVTTGHQPITWKEDSKKHQNAIWD